VIYSSTYTNDYLAAAVTEDLLHGGFWNQTDALQSFNLSSNSSHNREVSQPYIEIVSQMQNSTSNLTRLTDIECRSAFGTANIHSPYLNVLVVTNYTSLTHSSKFSSTTLNWGQITCHGFNDTSLTSSMFDKTETYRKWDFGLGSNWSLPVCNFTSGKGDPKPAHVQECLAQPASELDNQCTISISPPILIAVIVCNAAKALCSMGMLMAKTFHPVATVGGAVACIWRCRIGRQELVGR
jgi:hypothetical protein